MWTTIFNMLPDISGVLLAAVGVALVVAPEMVSKLPTWLRWSLAVLLVALGIAGLRSSFVQRRDDAKDKDELKHQVEAVNKQLSELTGEFPSLLSSLTPPSSGLKGTTPISLSTTFSNPQSLSLCVENKSNRVANGITWEVVLYRERDLALFSFTTQDIGYVKRHSKGQNYFMDLPNISKAVYGGDGNQQITSGDAFTGSIAIDCAECKGATYIVHLVWGVSGWTYELPNAGAKLAVTRNQSLEAKRHLVQLLNNLAPPSARTPIMPQ